MKTYSCKGLAAAYVRGEGQRQDIGLPEEVIDNMLRKLSIPEIHEARKVEWINI